MTPKELRCVRWMMGLVAFGLFVSGVTVFPALLELKWIVNTSLVTSIPVLHEWVSLTIEALELIGDKYPFLFYAGDWLAFAHIMLAVLFVGAMRDPLKNIWIVQFGLICCVAIIPLALICGPIRGIPWYWLMVDCAFAPAAAAPLWIAYRILRKASPEEEGRE